MIELAILTLLRGSAPLLALVGNEPKRIDLVDIAEGLAVPPYLTFNVTSAVPAGRPNLCNPAALGLLNAEVLVTPWADTVPPVKAMHDAVRAALLAAQRVAVDGVHIQSTAFLRFGPWAREPETNLLTRGQVFLVSYTE